MLISPADSQWCADYSRAAGEQLCGTAKEVDCWLLLENRGRWDRDVTDRLPPAAEAFVQRFTAVYPRIRVALIKQISRNSGPLAIFAALSRETASTLHSAQVESWDELGAITPAEFTVESTRVDRHVFAVCTHGTHDRCCAKYGTQVFVEMQKLAGDEVWQISHVGGCRFAPNVVCLPEGAVYGRLEAGDCEAVITAHRQRRIHLPRLRGRSCFPKAAQAAEFFLRSSLHAFELDLLSLQACDRLGAKQWRVVFHNRSSKQSHEIVVRATEEDVAKTYKSCAAEQVAARERFELVSFNSESGWGS